MLALKSRSIYIPFLIILLSSFIFSPSSYAQAKTTNYTYDALGRLTFVTDSVNGNRDYDYDKAGNRLLVSTNIASDATAEPGSGTLPAPTGLAKSQIANCTWRATWNSVPGAVSYTVKDTNNGVQYVTTTSANITCPYGNSSGNMPKSVRACDANLCGNESIFTN